MKRSLAYILILSGLILSDKTFCNGAEGARPFNFIFLDTGARPSALGGAYVAISDDANALNYNPAGLGRLKSNQGIFTHNEHFQGISQDYIAIGYMISKSYQEKEIEQKSESIKETEIKDKTETINLQICKDMSERERKKYYFCTGNRELLISKKKKKENKKNKQISQGIGIMYKRVNFGEIKRTTLSNPDGGIGKFDISGYILGIGYAKEIVKNTSMGFGIKLIKETIENAQGKAIAVDIGILHKPANGFSAGIAAQNIGSQASYQLDREKLPLNFNLGMVYLWSEGLLFALSVNQPAEGDFSFHYGMEYKIVSEVDLRIGYNGKNEAGNALTLGFGVAPYKTAFAKYELNYAFSSYGVLGDSHKIELTVQWK
ncbi:MAG: PorV/PorQ family protein [Elusimicrobia bacterium]|nr:PorV/PorQ family protein [Elusimicrobiota bacterium]